MEALEAGSTLLTGRFHDAGARPRTKRDGSQVTAADLESNEAVSSTLRALSPNIPIHSEELPLESRNTLSLYWVVDPLDGTDNFLMGLPQFTVAIGLVEEGSIVAAGAMQPCSRDWLYASVGEPSEAGQSDNRGRVGRVALWADYDSQNQPALLRLRDALYINSRRVIENWCPTFDAFLLISGHIDAIVYFASAADADMTDKDISTFLLRSYGYEYTTGMIDPLGSTSLQIFASTRQATDELYEFCSRSLGANLGRL